jgi:hypothetical protein
MVLSLVALGLLADIAPPPLKVKPAPPPTECAVDQDCVLSTFQGCCGACCAAPPHAVRRGVNEAARCAVIECALPKCDTLRCAAPPVMGEFQAVCEAGQCLARKKSAAPAQCQVAADCVVVEAMPPPGAACYQSACGCCPTRVAVPAQRMPLPLQQRDPPVKKKPASGPPFGLSTGSSAPTCSPCAEPPPQSATCRAGRCTLVR